METFHFIDFLSEYKALLGGVSIALATLIAVYFNYLIEKRVARLRKDEKNASYASAVACELSDNTDNLIDLYLEIQGDNTKAYKINQYQSFQMLAYETLLAEIGNLGSALSFMIVDVYGDLKKLSLRLDAAKQSDIQQEEDYFLQPIQETLVKSLTTSVIVQLYSDHLNGRHYAREVYRKREIWIERALDNFCSYVSESDEEMEFIDLDANPNKDFIKRFPRKEDRQKITTLLETIDRTVKIARRQPKWKASLVFRALAYEIQNTLMYFLNMEKNVYDKTLQQEYSQYLRA